MEGFVQRLSAVNPFGHLGCRFVAAQGLQQTLILSQHEANFMFLADEAVFYCSVNPGQQRVEVARRVEQTDRLGMQAELRQVRFQRSRPVCRSRGEAMNAMHNQP